MRYFFKALKIMAFVAEWSAVALEDEKVTAEEAARLVKGVCEQLGVEAEIDLHKVID